jgi:hypothetical protein
MIIKENYDIFLLSGENRFVRIILFFPAHFQFFLDFHCVGLSEQTRLGFAENTPDSIIPRQLHNIHFSQKDPHFHFL